MKKKFLALIALVLLATQTNAQDSTDRVVKEVIKKGNLLKSGNWQDVFTNFFQLAVKDLLGKEKSFEFKSTLFAIRSKLDASVNVDTNYVKYTFQRNFQFNTSLKLDTQYRFKNFSLGFTWAIVNKRDSTVISLAGQAEDRYFEEFTIDLTNALVEYKSEVPIEEFNMVQAQVQNMLAKKMFRLKDFPEKFRNKLTPRIEETFGKVVRGMDSLLRVTKKKPLLTFSVNSLFKNQDGLFNGGNAEMVYLQGLTNTGKTLELDLRGKLNVRDTVITNKRYRTEFVFTGGFNSALLTSKITNASLLELKPHIEYKRILRGSLPNEEEGTFFANAELRVRILKDLWIPLTLKYDLENSNFLGFLNVSLNLNAFK